MRKLTLFSLAAGSAVLASAAVAQPVQGQGPGHSWRQGGTQVMVRQAGPGHGRMHPGPDFRHRRLQRGFFIHPFWFGPQFHVRNWQLYGFARPPGDHRWVRFYDDAYLIDRRGRVADMRYDLDWDEYGESWELEDGIPSYYGRNDWHPDEEDYAWVEGHGPNDDGPGHRPAYGHGAYGPPMPAPACHPGPNPCGHGYSYAYPGYGYGVVYPIIIETTVTTGGCCERVVEEVVEVRQRSPRRPRPRPVRPRPRPPAGERG